MFVELILYVSSSTFSVFSLDAVFISECGTHPQLQWKLSSITFMPGRGLAISLPPTGKSRLDVTPFKLRVDKHEFAVNAMDINSGSRRLFELILY